MATESEALPYAGRSEIPIETSDCSASFSLSDLHPEDPEANSSRMADRTIEQPDFSSDANHSQVALPDGEELDLYTKVTYDETRRRSPLWNTCLVILLVVAVSLVVGVSVGLSVRSTEETSEMSVQASGRPNFSDIVEYLDLVGVTTKEVLETEGTPQNLAARWLAVEDKAKFPVPVVSPDNSKDRSGYLWVARYVMAVLFFAFDGDNWTTRVKFMTASDVCDWNGLSIGIGNNGDLEFEGGGLHCDHTNSLPEYLDLELNNMKGRTIPTEIGVLTTLKAIDLEHNDLRATIPSEICKLTKLEQILLTNNELTGQIPDCIGQLTKLHALHMELNEITGPLPNPGICSLVRLQSFIAQRNDLTGSIPDCIGNLKDLRTFIVTHNKLTSSIPDSFSEMSYLRNLWIDDNKLTGNPILALHDLKLLQSVYMENNHFTGDIDGFGWNFTQLNVLDLSNNNFTSSSKHAVPGHLFYLPEIRVLDVSRNQLEGHLPSELPDNSKMWFFSAHKNKVNGKIPKKLKSFDKLIHLDLSHNNLTGTLRKELFEMVGLRNLFLAENEGLDAGPIPEEVANMTQLEELSLKNTNREGKLPELLDFNQLVLLDLGNNDFTGTVPANYGRLPNLRYLILNQNRQLSGNPPTFENANQLETVLFDATNIMGDFNNICQQRKFLLGSSDSSSSDDATDNLILAVDCDAVDSLEDDCPCCHCCPPDAEEGCTDPEVANLDYTWERRHERTARDFAINYTDLINPVD